MPGSVARLTFALLLAWLQVEKLHGEYREKIAKLEEQHATEVRGLGLTTANLRSCGVQGAGPVRDCWTWMLGLQRALS